MGNCKMHPTNHRQFEQFWFFRGIISFGKLLYIILYPFEQLWIYPLLAICNHLSPAQLIHRIRPFEATPASISLLSLSLSHISISEFALWFWQLDDLHSPLPPPTPCLCLVSMGQGSFSLLLMIAHLAGLLQLHLFLIKFWLTDSHTRTATHTHTPSHTDTHNYSDICNYAAPCLTLD